MHANPIELYVGSETYRNYCLLAVNMMSGTTGSIPDCPLLQASVVRMQRSIAGLEL